MSRGIKGESTRKAIEERYGIDTNDNDPATYTKKITRATRFHIKTGQMQAFEEEYQCLVNQEPIPAKSKLIRLNPTLTNGLIILNSRLNNALNYPEQVRNPVILPLGEKITSFIVLQHHIKNSHAGTEIVFRSVRNEFWLLGGKTQVRKIIRQCSNNLCKYPNLQDQTQLMANLPISRINPGTFDAINLDLAGPFKIKQCI